MQALGFFHGVKTLFWAFARVGQTPRYWLYAWIPSAVLSTLLVLGIAGIAVYASPALDSALSDVTRFSWLNRAFVWISVAGGSLMAILAALLLTTPISAPALERLVWLTETDHGAPPREPLGLIEEFWCGIRAQAAPLLWMAPAWIVLFLIDMLAPLLSPLTATIRALLAAIGVAWALLDYPLTLRGISIRNRFRLLRSAPLPVLGFGAAFALLFWIPCCGIVFIGVGVVGATQLLLGLAEHHPNFQAVLSSARTSSK